MAFVSVKRVMERIARNHKNMQLDIHDVAMCCYEVVKEYGVYEGFERFSKTLPVENGTVAMPCNLYKIDGVRRSGSACADDIGYTIGTDCLRLDLNGCPSSVTVEGLVFKIDEDGHPMIPETLETPCYWYYMTQVLIDPVYGGSMPPTFLQDARTQFQDTLQTAKGSLQPVSTAEMDRISGMMRSFFIMQPPR